MSQPATVGPVDTTGQRGIGTNWAGNYSYRAARLVRPRSVDELCEVVAASTAVRALGSRHSFSDLTDTTGTLVDLAGLPADVRVVPTHRFRRGRLRGWWHPVRRAGRPPCTSRDGRSARWRRCRTSRSPAPWRPARTGRVTGCARWRRLSAALELVGADGTRAPGRARVERTSTGRWSRWGRSASSAGSSSTPSPSYDGQPGGAHRADLAACSRATSTTSRQPPTASASSPVRGTTSTSCGSSTAWGWGAPPTSSAPRPPRGRCT